MRQQLEGKRGEPAAKLFNVKVFPLLALQQLVFSYLCCVQVFGLLIGLMLLFSVLP